MTTMLKRLKRQHVVSQLIKSGVHTIEGLALDEVLYSTLLRTLALKRAADN